MNHGRLDAFGTSIFTEISQLAAARGAINLGQGFPDFEPPSFVTRAAARAAVGPAQQYAPAHGLPRLRSEIAAIWRRRWDRAVDAEHEITVCSGATEALFDSIVALVAPGDEVVMFEPFYDSYRPAVSLVGGTVRPVRLHPPDWRIDVHELERAFSARTKLVIVNTPHNPTGKVFTSDELDTIAALCRRYDATVVADEVYSELTYQGHAHVSIATRPHMWERTITVDSIGKTFSVTGWKVGWAVAPPDLTRAVRSVHQFVTFATATPLQESCADALAEARQVEYFATLRQEYARRRQMLEAALTAAGLPTLPIGGAYFLLSDITGWGYSRDLAFCQDLINHVGVAAIPPSAFYLDAAEAPALARFCFAKRESTLHTAATRLEAAYAGRHRNAKRGQ